MHQRPTAAHVPALKKLMIRHSKSQQIHGEDALSLPDCTTRAEVIDMSPRERAMYDIAACLDGCPVWLSPYAHEKHVNPTRGIEMRRKACSHCYEDVRSTYRREYRHFHEWPAAARAAWSGLHPAPALITDPNDGCYTGGVPEGLPFHELSKPKHLMQQLKELRAKDQGVRIIIFTEHSSTQTQLVSLFASQMSGWQIYEFNQATPPQRRHKIIREFQADHSGTYPAACIATYSTAAVGVTLTAASRVYLFEPCTSAATETQAAGRIHRLGQTKEIHIVRLVFRDSVEQALAAMHEARAKGEMDSGSERGRARLREAFRANHVEAAHLLVGPITQRTAAGGFGEGLLRCSYQRCSRCEQEVVVDRKKL